MPESKENIEDFVRKVVDQSESQIPFNESHWQQMESVLDAELPVGGSPSVGYYYFSNAISLLVGAILMWAWLSGSTSNASGSTSNPEVEVTTQPAQEVTSIATETNHETQGSTSDIENDTDLNEKNDDTVQIKDQSQSESNLIATSTADQSSDIQGETTNGELNPNRRGDSPELEKEAIPRISTDKVSSEELEKTETNSQQTAPSLTTSSPDILDSDKGSVDVKDNNDRRVVESEVPPPVDDQNNLEETSNEKFVARSEKKEAEESTFLLPVRKGIGLIGVALQLPDQLEKVDVFNPDGGSYETSNGPIVNGSASSAFSRFSVGISISPDLSSNEVFRYNRLGRDIGIVIDYWVTRRLSISLGAFNTSKRYLVGGEEYSPPMGFWGNVTNGERPATIDAQCQVLDIPINLKYQFVTRPKLNISVSAGVSSYIMLQEDYQYELSNGWKSSWGTSNENQHFFGVGNLQVHFERRFGKHMAFEVAPFFKVPLTGYGHGNIRFHSMGSLFTLRKYFFKR